MEFINYVNRRPGEAEQACGAGPGKTDVSYGQSYVRRLLFDFSERAMTAVLDTGQEQDVVALLLDKTAHLHGAKDDNGAIEAAGQWSRAASVSLSRHGARLLTAERTW